MCECRYYYMLWQYLDRLITKAGHQDPKWFVTWNFHHTATIQWFIWIQEVRFLLFGCYNLILMLRIQPYMFGCFNLQPKMFSLVEMFFLLDWCVRSGHGWFYSHKQRRSVINLSDG